jgi:hypothetical protein
VYGFDVLVSRDGIFPCSLFIPCLVSGSGWSSSVSIMFV